MNKTTQLQSIVAETQSPASAGIIFLHGLGADGHDFENIINELQLPEQLGIRFIFPHAPMRPVTLNSGFPLRAWYDIYSLNNFQKEDQEGIWQSQQAITQLIQEQEATGIPATRIILAGFSQGGAMALYTGLHYPKPLAGLIGLSTYLPLAPFFRTEAALANQHTPIFLGHGHYDNILPFHLGEQTRDFLQKASNPVEWHAYPMAHQVNEAEMADLSAWLQKILL